MFLLVLMFFYLFFIVSISLNGYLSRYASNWTNFQLKWSILDPNRGIFGNRPMGYWGGHHSLRAQGAVRNCVLKKIHLFLSLQTAARSLYTLLKAPMGPFPGSGGRPRDRRIGLGLRDRKIVIRAPGLENCVWVLLNLVRIPKDVA